jgi:predicted lactoylglutathione lyase
MSLARHRADSLRSVVPVDAEVVTTDGAMSKRSRPGRRLNMQSSKTRIVSPQHDRSQGTTMPKQIFVNIAVRDLPRSKVFYEAIGAVNNPQFTDETAACMVISDTIYVMLLTHAKWAFFTKKAIADTRDASEVSLALSCDNRQEVDAMVEAARAHGGKPDVNPLQDHGFMYGRSFEDLDGHVWEPFHMDMSQFPKG